MACKVHQENEVSLLCIFHDELVCSRCTSGTAEHAHCDTIPIANVVEKWPGSEVITILKKSCTEANTNVKAILSSLQDNKTSLTQSKQHIQRDVKELRKTINEALDNLETNLFIDMEKKYKNSISSINNSISRVEDAKKNVEKEIKEIERIQGEDDKSVQYIASKAMERKLKDAKENIKELAIDTDQYDFQLKLRPNIVSLLKDCDSLGKLDIVRRKMDINIRDSQCRSAQIPVMANPGNTCTTFPNLRGREEIRTTGSALSENVITGCLVVSNDRFIFLNRNEKVLKMQDKTGKLFEVKSISGCPYDITRVNTNNNVVAISFGAGGYMEIIDLNAMSVKNQYKLGGFCSGITSNEQKIYTVVRNRGIVETSMKDGSTKLTINLPRIDMGYIDVKDDKLVISNSINRVIQVFLISGELVWSFKIAKDTCPRGVLFTPDSGILVIDSKSSKLLHIRCDGSGQITLLDESSGLETPFCLSVHDHLGQLIICNSFNGCSFLYRI